MEDEVGLRVCDAEGQRGTIRYVGSVADTKGVWYGVDWDDQSRGKHDGSHAGVKYFWTWSPTSGSFVRRDKLRFGVSFLEAMHEKYVTADNELLVREKVEELKNSINAPFLEMVGFEKVHEEQKSFVNMKIVSLMDTRLSSAGPSHDEILQSCPVIEDLDLSRTLLASWFSVGEITCQMKHLQHLNLSNNKLPVPNDMEGVMEQLFPQGRIHTLTLGNMGYTWADIVKLVAHFPVTCLSVPLNKITTLDSVPSMFLSLEEMDLQANNLVDWGEVNALSSLPKLRHLNLNRTRLRNIKLDSGGGLFPCLETLFISENLIDSWDAISQLYHLPRLSTLRFTRNPVHSSDPHSAREKTIARLPGLTLLNGSVILSPERRGAEYDYIKEFGSVWLGGGVKRDQFIKANPRYEALVKIHGPPLQEESVPFKTKTTFSLHFTSGDTSITKQIPRSLSIAKLVNLVQRLFRTSEPIQTMYYTSEKNPEHRIEIDVESVQEIGYYNLQEGDTIHVSFADE